MRYKQIKAELEAVKDVIGVDAAAMDRILSNLQGSTLLGLPQALEQLLAGFARKGRQETPKLPGDRPAHISPGTSRTNENAPDGPTI